MFLFLTVKKKITENYGFQVRHCLKSERQKLLTMYNIGARPIITFLRSQKLQFYWQRRFLLVNVALPQHNINMDGSQNRLKSKNTAS